MGKKEKYVGLMRSYHESFKFDGFFAAPPPDAVLLPSPGCTQATDLTPPADIKARDADTPDLYGPLHGLRYL